MSRVRSSQRRLRLVPLLLLTLLWPATMLAQAADSLPSGGAGGRALTPTSDPVKLLITEVSVRGDNQEFVEITNLSGAEVDLSDYYLTDATIQANSMVYWRLPEGSPSIGTVGGGSFNDFHARFPDGFVLGDDETLVIAMAGAAAFAGSFGFAPDLELYGDGSNPAMRPVFVDGSSRDSITGFTTPRLDDASETLVLYHWDGESDHVTDIDVFSWGGAAGTRFSKTGVTIGGHTYQDETAVDQQQPYATATASGQSYQRTDMQETGQPASPGNGVGGRDEVGEPFAATWTIAAPDPGEISGGGPLEPSDVAKLLLTEVSVLGTEQEYIEIYNPNDFDVDLSDYYITDANYTPGNQHYWRIAEGDPQQGTVGGGDFYDFHARFPDGHVLPAGQYLVLAIAGSATFQAEFGFYPDLELHGAGPSPAMRPVFGDIDGPNSIVGSGDSNPPTLTNGSEIVVLYHWDGASDLVTDIDVFMWGTTASNFFSKTGVTIGGSTYQSETAVDAQQPVLDAPSFGSSFHRVDLQETGQPGPPGNGVGGRDELGEPLRTTWAIAEYDPAQPAQEGPPQILAAGLQTEYSGSDLIFRARVQPGTDPIDAVTVYFSVDGGAEQQLACTDAGGGYWEANLGEHPTGTEIAWRLVVTAGGDEDVWPEGGGTEEVVVQDPPEPGEAAKLLITEVSITGTDQEYVEIHNPNDFDVDMSDYYLTDAIHTPNSQFYWNITAGNPTQQTVGGGDYYDFHARFPDGFEIAAGDTAVVAIAGAQAYYNHFGFLPHVELRGDGAVPRMRPVFGDIDGPNSIVGTSDQNPPTLTNASETVVLYFWDGVSNLVTDIDMFFWGEATSFRFSKTGVTVGGETYQDETAVSGQQPMVEIPSFGFSFHRIGGAEAGQPGPPGNGVEGRDEVGEPLPDNFEIRAYDPARPSEQAGPLGDVSLTVPAKTFVPDLEEFAFEFTTLAGQETKLRVLDLQGRLVKTLFDSRFDGLPPLQVTWDGRDSTFERVRAGMYVIHLQAVDRTTGERTIKTAPVVVATRLKN